MSFTAARDADRAWRQIELVADRHTLRWHGIAYSRFDVRARIVNLRLQFLRQAFAQGEAEAFSSLSQRFADLELHVVLHALLGVLKEMLVIYASTVTISSAVGMVFGAGIGLGAGAALGVELGSLIVGALGLKSIAESFIKSFPTALSAYGQGIQCAWDTVRYRRPDGMADSERYIEVNDSQQYFAARHFAQGHEALVLALLNAIVLYLSRGQLKTLVVEARSGTLGDKFANWLERYGNKLQDRPELQARHSAVSYVPESKPLAMPAKKTTSPAESNKSLEPLVERDSASPNQLTTNKQKSLVGEQAGRGYMQNAGFERISGDKRWNAAGVDDIWKNTHPPPDYVIAEYKYGSSGLGQTKDGLQMSDDWLSGEKTGFDRIEHAVGHDQADDILSSLRRGQVEKWLVRTDDNGVVSKAVLDSAGKVLQ